MGNSFSATDLILDTERLIGVLEPVMMAYAMNGFRFEFRASKSTCRFDVYPPKELKNFMFVVARRDSSFAIGYNRTSYVWTKFSHIDKCQSYEEIPELLCWAIELWKAGE